MSMVPEGTQGDAWRDAGLRPVDPDEPVRLTDEPPVPDEPEDYEPAPVHPTADPDQADEADVVDQAAEVVLDDEDDE